MTDDWKEALMLSAIFMAVMVGFAWVESEYGCASGLYTPEHKCLTMKGQPSEAPKR